MDENRTRESITPSGERDPHSGATITRTSTPVDVKAVIKWATLDEETSRYIDGSVVTRRSLHVRVCFVPADVPTFDYDVTQPYVMNLRPGHEHGPGAEYDLYPFTTLVVENYP